MTASLQYAGTLPDGTRVLITLWDNFAGELAFRDMGRWSAPTELTGDPMRNTATRADAHQSDDCDTTTCPLCVYNRAEDTVLCDECGQPTPDPTSCAHGRENCDPCIQAGEGCHHCTREAIAEASGR